ncbi:peptide/nickel transport system ATP-binding protein [Bradyrhizobium lablabi]|uniref:Peptide/nickel transport system ATP-binding protein n=2 Tax=Bradyrhizobium TaxID=374 RepID=A0ABY0PE97_9BRAD|nr:peptide/nickel transport system ATP-binding protein [Bradyrhizobium ottawaense]SED74355.1 peptide/nickel transport system ATP-binding protein [Bradyrhizobium lablabi]SHL69994.1 peptide/nickel transport system ATP-binding protein [Bradyrhizobium lablabi]
MIPLLSIENLRTSYTSQGHTLHAVDGVSLEVREHETVGLVGESGCGKSTLGKTIVRLLRPSEGAIRLNGEDISQLKERSLRTARRTVQMVFQDPFGSLNPRQRIGTILDTPLKVHGINDAKERLRRTLEITNKISIPQDALQRYPHEFSGGQRQRIGIARALILRPRLLVCDEPVSALDLSIQAQILNLLVDLKKDLGLSYLFISHDLSVVRYFADRVLVMYLGRIVESADHVTLWRNPRHPYTRALLASIPSLKLGKKPVNVLPGEVGQGVPERGCRFRARCPVAVQQCETCDPPLRKLPDGNAVACHLA